VGFGRHKGAVETQVYDWQRKQGFHEGIALEFSEKLLTIAYKERTFWGYLCTSIQRMAGHANTSEFANEIL
jgi:hypothetical protein